MQRLILADNKYCFLDRQFLQEQYDSGRLKGARVFGYLFQLENAGSPFDANTSMITNANGDITICQLLNIQSLEWIKFMSFLKIGMCYSFDVGILADVSGKFGTVPSIDKYYEEVMREEYEEQVLRKSNPMRPAEDVKKQFTWTISFAQPADDQFHATVPVDEGSDRSSYFFFRRRKEAPED